MSLSDMDAEKTVRWQLRLALSTDMPAAIYGPKIGDLHILHVLGMVSMIMKQGHRDDLPER